MNIFENLENLNVSEACFEDIMSIVEDIFSTIDKQEKKEGRFIHPDKRHRYNKLREKVLVMQRKEKEARKELPLEKELGKLYGNPEPVKNFDYKKIAEVEDKLSRSPKQDRRSPRNSSGLFTHNHPQYSKALAKLAKKQGGEAVKKYLKDKTNHIYSSNFRNFVG